jgi:hypothetical protein
LELICLARRLIGAQSPAVHALEGARRSATARNKRASGKLVGNWMRMREACSMVFVGDRGMVTSHNLAVVREHGHGYIVGRNRRRSGEVYDYRI